MLARVLAAVESCGPTPESEKAQALLRKRTASLEITDQKMEAAIEIWRAAPANCRRDPLLNHLIAKVHE